MSTAEDPVALLAREAETHDRVAPFDEATLMTLARHPERVRRWLHPDAAALAVGDELGLVVRPSARGRGEGSALLAEVLRDVPTGELRAWSHGDHPAAGALARRHGFDRARELWVMRRPSSLGYEAVSWHGFELRGFQPGDEAEIVRVNAAAFAGHPEQGAMDLANLAERMAEPWFDPAGLITAWQGDRLAGFHWTKRHDARHGEVYVIGVDPGMQGSGLGRLLLQAGLRHLIEGGAAEVLLYVESDNPAVRLYQRAGFAHTSADTHVQYVRRQIRA